MYIDTLREAIRLGLTVNPKKNKSFSFSDYPSLREKVNALFGKFASTLLNTIDDSTERSWLQAAKQNDKLVNSIFKSTKLTKEQLSGFMDRNLNALKAFQERKSGGLNLSDRVWNMTDQFKTEIELTLDVGIGQGTSAAKMARQLTTHLNEPEKLFRRVRNTKGSLSLSKAAKAYHPGQGVNRSSFKNAMRVTRTEVNMAYRASDHERWQQLDFVVGYRISRSNHIYFCVLCDSMVGDYPKGFKFVGWHPQCRCVKTSILITEKERDKMLGMILRGESTKGFKSENSIKKMPEGYVTYINDNKKSILRRASTPYFVKDNYKDGDLTKGLKLGI